MASKRPTAPLTVAWTRSLSPGTFAYSTAFGAALVGRSEAVLDSPAGQALRGTVHLVLTYFSATAGVVSEKVIEPELIS